MTREEAVKRIKTLILKINEPTDTSLGWLESWIYKEDVEAFDMAIKTLEQEPRWIPVTEKLPEVEEEATRCLVTVDVGESFDDYTAIRTYFSDTKDFNDVVTAWMPLPEPYKAGREESNG